MVNASSLPDIAIAASLVAAGLGDAVVFAESASALGNANADIIREQQPAQVILVGGTAALTTDLETELRGLVNDLEIERLAGMDRLHTAALAAEKVLERAASAATGAPDDPSEPTVVLANAWSLPDVGIAAAAVTGGRAEVLLYAADGWLSSPTATVLRNHRPTRLVVAGTPTTFSHQVVAEALSAADSTGPASRLDGTNTAESVALAVKSAYPDDIAIAVVASDSSLQDIGAAVALAAALDRSPVLLVHDDQLPNDANTLLLEHQPSHIVIVDTELNDLAESLTSSLELFAPTATISQISSVAELTRRAVEGLAHDRSANSGFTSISTGNNHVCGLRDNGTIACWGVDTEGNTTPPEGTFTAVATGGVITCALHQDGSPECWGSTADRRTSTPDGPFVAITAGWAHACGLTATRSVECWGDRWGAESLIPTGAPFLAVSAGKHHTCGLEPSLNIECWGQAEHGQLNVPDGVFYAVTAGDTHSCGLEYKGSVECWGDRTGNGSVFPGVYASRRYVSVDAGSFTTCGLRPTRVIDCWGNEELVDVPRGLYTAMSVGGSFACALRTNTRVVCWGALPELVWEPFNNTVIRPDP